MRVFLIAYATVFFVALGAHAYSEERASITIPLTEYQELKEAVEAGEDAHYWEMTFSQILVSKLYNYKDAWKLYDFWQRRNVYLNGQITRASVSDTMVKMAALDQVGKGPIYLNINSLGGDVIAGIEFINFLNTLHSPVYTICNGTAMSMASVILVVGDYRIANESCMFMMHDVGFNMQVAGTSQGVEVVSQAIDLELELKRLLSENSGLSMKDINVLAAYDSFYNAEETFRLGFVDEVRHANRSIEPGTRGVPEDLIPENRIAESVRRKLEGN